MNDGIWNSEMGARLDRGLRGGAGMSAGAAGAGPGTYVYSYSAGRRG